MSTQNKKHFKNRILFTRVGDRTLGIFDYLVEARGLRRSEAMRQIIEAWMRQPETLPIGSPIGMKSMGKKD